MRRNSCFANLSGDKITLSLAQILHFNLTTADVQVVYTQSEPIKEELFVPSLCVFSKRSTVWKFLSLPYGKVEAGRQWFSVIEEILLNMYEL